MVAAIFSFCFIYGQMVFLVYSGGSIDGLEAIMHSKVCLEDGIVTVISILYSRVR